MLLNVTLPLLEQLQGGVLYELSEIGSDDTEEGGNKEKEKEKEKDAVCFGVNEDTKADAAHLELFRKSLFVKNDLPIAEPYTSLPERPPQA